MWGSRNVDPFAPYCWRCWSTLLQITKRWCWCVERPNGP